MGAAAVEAFLAHLAAGSRNYVAWFQAGWLNWKAKSNLAEAEEAFYQAARLSSSKADLYHAYSLRHLAYMQDLQGRPAEAYDTVQKALHVTSNDHDTMYDAARYAAKTGRERETLEMLDKCIDLQPQTTHYVFRRGLYVMSAALRQGLASLLVHRTEEGRTKARRHIEAWQSAVTAVQQAEKMAECNFNVPTETINGAQGAAAQIGFANYVQAVYLENKATTERNSLIETATRALQEKIEECQRTQVTAKQEILKAETVAKKEVQIALTNRDSIDSWVRRDIIEAEEERDSRLRVLHDVVLVNYMIKKNCISFSSAIESAYNWAFGMAIVSVVVFISLVEDYTVLSLIMVGFIGFLAPIALSAIRYLKAKAAYKAMERREVSAVNATFDQKFKAYQQRASTAEQKLREVPAASEKHVLEVRSKCENTMKRAEGHRKKAEDALRWFQAHV